MSCVIDYPPCPRKCVDCDGSDHHWIPDFDEEWEEPVMKCKHCPTQRPLGDNENPDEPDFRRATRAKIVAYRA